MNQGKAVILAVDCKRCAQTGASRYLAGANRRVCCKKLLAGPMVNPHDRPLVRGKCKRLVLSLLPCTTSVVASAIQRDLPDISRKSAVNGTYQALLRLEAKGVVVQDFEPDGCLWRAA
jgi:hypothetical protein